MNVLSLFSGIGGLDLGLERAGMTIAGQVEIDPWCRKVLAKHWPEVPRHDDVRTAAEWWGGRAADLVCGGFPCQPVSEAGLWQAQDDPRWLWPAFAGVLRGIRPRLVLVENVPGLLDRGMADVLGDLASLGYHAEWSILSACAMGAPHPRERLFIVAHAAGQRWHQGGSAGHKGPALLVGEGLREGHRRSWAAESRPNGVAYGVPARMDRNRGLGNAVVPQVAEHIGRLIMEAGVSGYNPGLAWLNQWRRPVLVRLFAVAYPVVSDDAGLLTTDQLKKGLLVWAEGRHGVASLEGLEAG